MRNMKNFEIWDKNIKHKSTQIWGHIVSLYKITDPTHLQICIQCLKTDTNSQTLSESKR